MIEIEECTRMNYHYGEGGINITLELQNIPTIKITDETNKEEANNKTLLQVWERRVDAYAKQMITQDENMTLDYSLVWGKWSKIMSTKVEANEKYEKTSLWINAIILLTLIKDISYC